MDRLTKHDARYRDPDEWANPRKIKKEVIELEHVKKRLQRYEDIFEDIEMIPADRLAKICAAEQDGRLLVLPCKVGDICYEIDPGHSGVIEHTVTATTIYSKKADGKRYMEDFSNLLVIETYAVAEDGCEWTDQYTAEEWTDAPKTRAEAEAALKGDAPNE